MTNFIKQHGRSLVDNGFHIVPVAPENKFPAQYTSGQWHPMKNWERFGNRQPSDIELRLWSAWKDCSVGIPCSQIAVVDIDVLDADAALKLEALAREMLGDTPCKRVGQYPKMALIYRTAKDIPGIKRHPLEVLGKGQQFVAYGIHPKTKEPYFWPDSDLAEIDVSDLPLVTEAELKAFLDAGAEIVPPELRQSTLAKQIDRIPDTATPVFSEWGQEGDYDAIASALDAIPNDDVHYDDWMRICLAIKGALGASGRDLWLSWSGRSQKDEPAYTARKWDHDTKTVSTIGAGSIYEYARQYGWTPPIGAYLNPAKQEAAEIGATIAANLTAPNKRTAPAPAPKLASDPFPQECVTNAPGLVGQITEWITNTATKKQPELALANTIAALGALFGRRYVSETGILTNIYMVGLAGTGTGKDHSRRQIKKLFVAANQTERLGSDNIISSAGLLQEVSQKLSLIMSIDEFGAVMEAMSTDRTSESKKIARNLLTLYSDAQSSYNGGTYADPKLRQNTIIVNPCLSIYGTSTAIGYFDALSRKAVTSGELNRFIIIPSQQEKPARVRGMDTSVPGWLAERLAKAAEDNRPATGNMQGLLPNAPPKPMETVPMTDEARDLYYEAQDFEDERAYSTDLTAPLWGRYSENVMKVAMIGALADSGTITADIWRWAETLIHWTTKRMSRDVERYVSDGAFEKLCNGIVEAIRRAGGEITAAKLACTHPAKSVPQRERNEALNTLAEQGRIEITKEPQVTNGVISRKPATVIKIT